MYTLLVSLASAVATYALVAILFDPFAAIVPGLFVLVLVGVALLLRVKRRVDDALVAVGPLLQDRKVDDAKLHLQRVRDQWAKWMPLLDGQIDAQLGMIDYYQLKFDAALPKLEKGKWRNWMALALIGCIHFRRGRRPEAWKALQEAVDASPKEVLPYAVFAALAHRAEEDDKALAVVSKGLEAVPGNKMLEELKARLANKRKFKPDVVIGEQWAQFFPEDLVAQAQIAARKGTPLPGSGFRPSGITKQMRRGR